MVASEKRKAYLKGYYEKNREKLKESQKVYRDNNPEKIKASSKVRYGKIREEQNVYLKVWRKKNPEKINVYHKVWRKNNREKTNATTKTYYSKNPSIRIAKNLRERIRQALKGISKSARTEKLLGCSFDYFRKYYFSLFTGDMTITDVMNGRIHIDHIKPCASFDLTTKEEQRKCFHYTNLQPLWAVDNLSKGARCEKVTCN